MLATAFEWTPRPADAALDVVARRTQRRGLWLFALFFGFFGLGMLGAFGVADGPEAVVPLVMSAPGMVGMLWAIRALMPSRATLSWDAERRVLSHSGGIKYLLPWTHLTLPTECVWLIDTFEVETGRNNGHPVMQKRYRLAAASPGSLLPGERDLARIHDGLYQRYVQDGTPQSLFADGDLLMDGGVVLTWTTGRTTLAHLADRLSQLTGHPVLDSTVAAERLVDRVEPDHRPIGNESVGHLSIPRCP